MLPALRNRWQKFAVRLNGGRGAWRGLEAWVARAPLLASIALGVAIGAQLTEFVITFVGDFAIASTSGVRAVGRSGTTRGTVAAPTAFDALLAAHLFGIAPSTTAARSSSARSTRLVLTGIIATGNPHDGFAILGPSGANTHVFHTGSQVGPGTILAEVYPQQVVLLRGQERQVLMLPKASAGPQLGTEMTLLRTAPSEPIGEVASEGEDGMAQQPPADRFRPPPLSDGSAILQAFAMRPVSIEGGRGVRIMGTGINSTALAALGLEPGDVITAINEQPLGGRNTPDLAEALKSGTATLTVLRDGNATSVTIDAGSAAVAAQDYRDSAPAP